MTIHVPPWYFAMMAPALCFYIYTWKVALPGMTITGVTQRGLATMLLSVVIGGIQSTLCWPIYFSGLLIGGVAGWLDGKDEYGP